MTGGDAVSPRDPAGGEAAAPRGQVLIIADDNQAMRWLVRAAFRERFAEILEASDGRELFWQLLQCSRTRDPADVVVITDIRMPAYSGLDVLAAYDELGFQPATIVMTSFPDDHVVAQTERVGGILLAKPFATAELRRVVDHAIRR